MQSFCWTFLQEGGDSEIELYSCLERIEVGVSKEKMQSYRNFEEAMFARRVGDHFV